MSWLSLMLVTGVLFGAPMVTVQQHSPHAISVAVDGVDSDLEECIPSGFKLRYRYELQLCKSQPLWFSHCKDTRVVVRTIEYDVVGQTFKLNSDQLGDGEESVTVAYQSLAEALRAISRIEQMPLRSIGGPDDGLSSNRRWSIVTRVLIDCKGDYSKTLSDISYFLTLGLVRLSQYNTGWQSTDLASRD